MRLIIPIIALFLVSCPVFQASAQSFVPVANGDSGSTTESTPVTIAVLLNDTDADPNPLDPLTIDFDHTTTGIQPEITIPAGKFAANALGQVVFTPNAGFSGNAQVTYTVNDDTGATSNEATITVYVDGKPVAVNDVATTLEDQAKTINILSNDSDPENAINANSVDLDPTTAGRQTSLAVTNGLFVVDAAGVVTFTPNADFNGSASVTYTIEDALQQTSNTATLSVTVEPVNDAPTFTGSPTLSMAEDTPRALQITDLVISDIDNTTGFSIVSLGAGSNYSVSGLTITPALNYNGNIIVPVVITDGTTPSAPTNVTINVTAVNDAPTFVGSPTLSTPEETGRLISTADLVISDVDNDNGFTIVSVGAGSNYTVSGFTVTPALNYNGNITVPVVITDGTTPSAPTNITINVTPVNDAPTFVGLSTLTTPEETGRTLSVADFTISDVDNNSGFSIVSVGAGSNYTVSGFTVTPALDYNGNITVPVVITDGTTPSTPTNITINVTAVNDAPSINGQPQTLTTDEEKPFTILASHVTISDVDNNSGFVISSVADGDHYSVSGNTVTPDLDYNGPIDVPIRVSDGSLESNSFALRINVAPVNDPPIIQSIASTPATEEDKPFSLTVSNLNITDPDNTTFTLLITDGDNYSVSGTTITPDPDYFGNLSVPVRVSDGNANSNVVTLTIPVTPVNDPPSIVSQTATLNVLEDNTISLQTSHLSISDPDNTSGFTLQVQSGTNYTASGTNVTPNLNYYGPLSVPVTVTDGDLVSNTFQMTIQVTAVNDPPVITDHRDLTTLEDTPITIQLSDLTFSDPDNTSGFTIVLTDGDNYSVSGAKVTPDPNYHGTLTVPLLIFDGSANSNTVQMRIVVESVNDVPVIQNQSTLNTDEDKPITILVSNLTIVDPDHTSFTLSLSDGPNYSVNGAIVTPDTDFSGQLTVPLTVSDGVGTSSTFNLKITVNPVNDTPVITGQAVLTTPEDTPLTLTLAHLTIFDPDNTTFTLNMTDGINYSLSGHTIHPDPNYFGPLVVPIQVSDGVNNSLVFNVQVTVTSVNDVPVINGQSSLSTLEDQPITVQASDLSITDFDHTTGFTVILSPGANYTVAGNVVTPAADFFGTLTVGTKVSDGTDQSASFPLEIEVEAVNDAPRISGQSAVAIAEEGQVTIQLSHLTFTDPDHTTGFVLVVSDGADYSVSGNTVTADANFNGVLNVPVSIHDGVDSSLPFTFHITVTPVNDAPVITGQKTVTTAEETSRTIAVSDLIIVDPDNSSGFVLTVLTGDNYTLSGQTITPSLNFNGILDVPVRVSDGSANSNQFTLKVEVTPVNDPPVITDQVPLGTPEDTPLTLRVSDLVVSDPDNTPSSLQLIVSPGANYTVSGTTITPALNYNGPLTVPVSVFDGATNSNTFNLEVLVSSVNNAPVITGQVPLKTNEEQSITIVFGNLTVTDADNTYPTGFTLNVQSGTNYTVSGTTVTPATNFNGTLSVPVQVNDGTANSNVFSLQIQVDPVNDAPVITGQKPVSTNEDQPKLIALSDLVVSDPDDTYPSDFTLTVLSGTNYTFSGNTITPAANFNGVLIVRVRVNDGAANSPDFDLLVDVTPVNDAPVITGQGTIETDEDEAITIQLFHLLVTDIDNSYPTGFSLTVASGSNYTVSGNTVTPNANYNGTLKVPVQVSDGSATSASFTLDVVVKPENDRPVISGQTPVSTPEEQAITIVKEHLTVIDPDDNYPADFTLTVSPGLNYTLSGNTISPALNFNGTLSVPVRVNDGSANSDIFNLQVQVLPVNDAPVITGQAFVGTAEDQPVTIQLAHLTVTDVDNNYPTGFTLEVLPFTGYTFTGTTITPAEDFAGTLTVKVRVNDGAANSNTFDLKVQVNSANDVPVITGQVAISTNEETPITIQLSHLIVTDPDNTYPQDFTLSVLSGTNYSASGNTVTPAVDLNGPLTIKVLVNDGLANSNTFDLQLQVNPVNDVPVITGQVAINSPEDETLLITTAHITVSDPDDTYPADFTLTVLDGTNYTRTGNSIKPALNFTGPLSVPVRVNDGSANSATFNLQVTITPVNDPPTITGQVALTTPEETPITLEVSNLVITDPDDVSGFSLIVSPGEHYTFSGNIITPAADFNGVLQVPVQVNDGDANSNVFNVKITVTPMNDVPVITAQKAVSTLEDTPITLSLSSLVFTDPDNTSGFSLIVSAGANYTFSGTTVTPNLNFNGTLTIPVRVFDGTGNSSPFNLQVTVDPVNDAPKITGQQPLSTLEDRAIPILFSHLIVFDPDNNYPAGFNLNVLPGDHYVYTNGAVVPELNFNGTLRVKVVVQDGIANSEVFELQIEVTPVNDAPVITSQKTAITTNEDEPVNILISHVNVSDPDNTTGFTLSVLQGTNYTATGNTIRPATNFNGTLTVPVQVSDGSATSAVFNLTVMVTPVNDAPVITGQVPLSTNEEQPLQIQLADLIVTDAESLYPSGFSLTVLAGTNYTVSGNTITPSTNFNGTLSVNVRVNDGAANSAVFGLQVVVNPVNDPPVITAHTSPSTPEETAFTVQLSHLVIADPDNTSGFTLTVSNGVNYTRTGNTITPDKDFNGTLTVPVQVRDAGGLASNSFDLKVLVTPVNDPPVIIGQKILSTGEDVPIVIKPSDLTIQDPDNTSFTVQIQAGSQYTFSGSTVTPQLDFNGTLNVNVKVSDGSALSPTFVLQIQVGDANDPPVITGQMALTVKEDESITLQKGHFTVADPDNTYPADFTLSVLPGTNYTVSGTTVTPNPNYFGSLTVPVNVNDGVNNSAIFNAIITVTAVNDAPSMNDVPNQQVPENSGQHVITLQNISKGPLENSQSLVFIASSGNTSIIDNPTVTYDGTGVTATLTYTVKPNASGVVTITLGAVDNGSPPATYTTSFQIEVMEVNAAPTLNAIGNVIVAEDSQVKEIPLTGITAGVGEIQTLTVTVVTDKPELFDPAPSIQYQSPDNTGVLRLTPKANAFGTATVSVTVTDNGSNISPNVNRVTRSFSFIIESVNDLPVIQSIPVLTGVVGEPYSYEVVVTDVENEAIAFSLPVKPDWMVFVAQGSKGTVSGTPTAGGQQNVSIVATDASNGKATQNYTIDVNTRPTLTTASASVIEDQVLTLPVASVFTDVDGDVMTELKITSIPQHGVVKSGNTEVAPGTPIPASSFGTLVYQPDPDYAGRDTVRLNASDGRHYSLQDTYIAINITAVNDAPVVTFIESDTLAFEVDGQPKNITAEIVIEDPDDVNLKGADIAFTRLTYKRDDDVLLFQNTTTITGTFDPAAGVLVLTGEAPVAEYIAAIRSVQYNYLETVDPVVEQKTITISLTDGKSMGIPKERHLMLMYSFTDLEIPSAFTPNADQINDTWYIAPPGGELSNAVVKVFNHRGVTVYESKGFENPWDGTFKGELLPAGTYFYTIDLKLTNKKTYKGTVTILR